MSVDELRQSPMSVRREVYDAHTYITEHFMEELTWKDVAEHVGLSGNYLRSLYVEVYRDSLIHTVTGYRLNYAARLLVTTTRQVKDIGNEAMFADSAYFCRKFREWYGMTPTQFRKKYSGDRNCESFVERGMRAVGE